MNETEAMTRALEFAVSRGLEKVPDGPKILAVLQKNAAALSERQAKRDARKSWCFCGRRKGPVKLVCTDCFPAIPLPMLLRYWVGSPAEQARARADIETICETRGAEAARARFAPVARPKARGGARKRPGLREGLRRLTEEFSERGLT